MSRRGRDGRRGRREVVIGNGACGTGEVLQTTVGSALVIDISAGVLSHFNIPLSLS